VSTKAKNPHVNREAERGTLGGVLIAGTEDPAQVERVLLLLRPEDFYEAKHATIFTGIQALHASGQPPDIVLLDEWLTQAGKLGEVGQAYVHELVNTCVSVFQTDHYARVVLENAIARHELDIYNDGLLGKSSKAEVVERLDALARRLDVADSETNFTLDELMREELPPLKVIVPGFVYAGLSALAAKPKIGKSWLAFALAIAVASGGVVLSQRVEQGDVLYLALEDGKRRLQSRARKLLGDEPVPKRLTFATKMDRLNAGGLAYIERWLKGHPDARLVIIDVWAKVKPPQRRNGDLYAEDYAAASSLKAVADHYGVAVVVVHHTRKASAEDVNDEISGTTGFAGACDTLMVIQRARGEAEAALHVTGRDIEVDGQHALRFDQALCIWSVMTAEEAAHAREEALSSQRKAILAVLKAAAPKCLGPRAIATQAKLNEDSVRVLLLKMLRDNEVTRQDRGEYTIPVNIVHNDNVDGAEPGGDRGGADVSDVNDADETSNIVHNAPTPLWDRAGAPDVNDVNDVNGSTQRNGHKSQHGRPCLKCGAQLAPHPLGGGWLPCAHSAVAAAVRYPIAKARGLWSHSEQAWT